MPLITEISEWADVPALAVWTLAVLGMAKGLFGFPAAEVQRRLHARQVGQAQRPGFGMRAGLYLLGCLACQTFWVCMCLAIVTRGVGDLLGVLVTAAAVSGTASMLGRSSGVPRPLGGCGCGGENRAMGLTRRPQRPDRRLG
jgi:hypothetical protein